MPRIHTKPPFITKKSLSILYTYYVHLSRDFNLKNKKVLTEIRKNDNILLYKSLFSEVLMKDQKTLAYINMFAILGSIPKLCKECKEARDLIKDDKISLGFS